MDREALHSAAVQFALDLHPSATGDVMQGVRDQLNASLLRPSIDLDGVLVSYTNPRIVSHQARIHPYFPYFHVNVSADCVLFKPVVGQILDGKVTVVSHDFIALLVLGLFNVAIGRQQIRADLSYDGEGESACWKSQKHTDHVIIKDTPLRFRVERVDDESEFFTLAGSLLAAGTGSIAYLTQQSKKKSKKRRRSEATATDTVPHAAAGAAVMEAAVEAAVPSARASAMPDGLPAKTKKKAAKEQRKAAKQQSADADSQQQAAAGASEKQAAPDSVARFPESKETADGKSKTVSPKKKKRRKHQDTSAQAPSSDATPWQSAVNSPSTLGNAGRAGDIAPHSRAAAESPAAEDSHAHGTMADGQEPSQKQTGAHKAKQKSHKKKKRDIDKPGLAIAPAAAPSGQSAAVSQKQSQPAATPDAAASGSAPKKKRKKHKDNAG